MTTIVVTGANGQLGRLVVTRLLERGVPASSIGVSVRDPSKATALAERGVRVRRGDFTDATTLTHAFESAQRILIISSNSGGAETVAHHSAAIDAAKAAGAKRIVYTSHMGAKNPQSSFMPMRAHAATENLLKASGVPFTALRNGFYADSVPHLLDLADSTGHVKAPADGSMSWTSHSDLADVAVLALTSDEIDGVTDALTGPEALDMNAVVAIASEVSGRSIQRVLVSDAEYTAFLVSKGIPEQRAAFAISIFAAAKHGDFAPASDTLSRLLGRQTQSLKEILKVPVIKQ